jgi:predicted  nucleic acid-binding Zn-ribbon protein
MDELQRLRERAEHWRTMARHITDAKAIEALNAIAARLEERIAQLERDRTCGQPESGSSCGQQQNS